MIGPARSALAVLVTLVLAAGPGSAAPAGADAAAEWDLVAAANAARRDAGLPPLLVLPAVRDLARAHAGRMADERRLHHNPGVAADVEAAVPDYTRLAENVGRGATSQDLHSGFMASAVHRDNLLGSYRYAGIGAVASGGSLWVTQVFVDAPPGKPFDTRTPAVSLGGGPAVGTSLAVSRHGFDDGGSDAVVVARSDDFADALAGGPLAAVSGGPVLLTARATVPEGVVAEARRVLGPGGTVYLLGGLAALSLEVELRFAREGLPVVRVAGSDRYDTAARVARLVNPAPDTVLLASGLSFADAIAAGAVGGAHRMPILLTAGGTLPSTTTSYLASVPRARRVVLGGTAVISEQVASAAAADERVFGPNRYATAVAIARRWLPDAPTASFASGAAFQSALVGSPLSAAAGAPLLLADRPLADAAYGYARERGQAWREALVYGEVADEALGLVLV